MSERTLDTCRRLARKDMGPAAIGRIVGLSRQRVDQLLHPEKARARAAVHRAVRSGRLRRPAICDRCGRGGRIEAHHDDYSRRLVVRWLCQLEGCHGRGGKPRRVYRPRPREVAAARESMRKINEARRAKLESARCP